MKLTDGDTRDGHRKEFIQIDRIEGRCKEIGFGIEVIIKIEPRRKQVRNGIDGRIQKKCRNEELVGQQDRGFQVGWHFHEGRHQEFDGALNNRIELRRVEVFDRYKKRCGR